MSTPLESLPVVSCHRTFACAASFLTTLSISFHFDFFLFTFETGSPYVSEGNFGPQSCGPHIPGDRFTDLYHPNQLASLDRLHDRFQLALPTGSLPGRLLCSIWSFVHLRNECFPIPPVLLSTAGFCIRLRTQVPFHQGGCVCGPQARVCLSHSS